MQCDAHIPIHFISSHTQPTPPHHTQHHRERSFLLFAAVKIAALVLQLLRLLLWRLPRPELILVQNPPSIPTLAVAWLTARLRGAALVVDWHNLGFSILSHSRGSDRHPLVRVRGVGGIYDVDRWTRGFD